jgi:hypothetical protein
MVIDDHDNDHDNDNGNFLFIYVSRFDLCKKLTETLTTTTTMTMAKAISIGNLRKYTTTIIHIQLLHYKKSIFDTIILGKLSQFVQETFNYQVDS